MNVQLDTGVLPAGFGVALSDDELSCWKRLPACQQPNWEDNALAGRNRRLLARSPGLVYWREVRGLRLWLAEVAAGRALVLQAGDCAESPADCTPPRTRRRLALLDILASRLAARTGVPVLRVGRIAGQFAKPRTTDTECRDGTALPVFRGHLVNAPEWDPQARRADANRLLSGYVASRSAMNVLRGRLAPEAIRRHPPIWSSHEALLLDYELPLLRREANRTLLTSTHWPWIGERTRHPDQAHVRMLATITNPVACKLGPETDVSRVVRLCDRLDPHRQPGRLTLIARMGADVVGERLPRLVHAVRDAGHPVIWLCDPMHGNTELSAGGVKTRWLEAAIQEVVAFGRTVRAAGAVAGGLHLETTPDSVSECVGADVELAELGTVYTTLCDPRLNPRQAAAVIQEWGR